MDSQYARRLPADLAAHDLVDVRDQAQPYPDPPELFSDGLAAAIWT
jgi:hypothetical protein